MSGKGNHKWSEYRSQKQFFIGHNIRNCLLLVLIVLLVINFAEYLLTEVKIWYIKFIPITALISVIICQVFYSRLEEYGKHHFLGVSLMFWICSGVCRNLTFLSNCWNLDLDLRYVRFTTSFITAFLVHCLMICDGITLIRQIRNKKKSSSTKTSVSNEIRYLYKHMCCSWYSKITFYWLTPILHLGYVNSLGSEHAPHIPKSEASSSQFNKLENAYFKNSKGSLWKSIVKLYWKTFVIGGFLKLLGDVAGLILPLGISVVITYIEMQSNQLTPQKSDGVDHFIKWQEFLSNGYVFAIIVFFASLAQGTLSQNSTHIINVEGIRLKNALQGLIYSKLLRIRRRHFPTDSCNPDSGNIGYITNLVTEDSCNIMSCFWIGNYIWAIPLKILLLIFLLYKEIGISAVIGSIGSIILMLLSQFIIGMKMSRNYKSISEWSDKRLRRLNEILQGIRFIKLCGWETDFIDEVSMLRNKELKHLNLDSVYWTTITFLANTSSIIVAVVTITLHYILRSERITLSTLFTSLALFNQLTVPLFIFPIMVPIIISAMVSAKRIEKFLSLPDIEIPAQVINMKSMKNNQMKLNLSEKMSDSLKTTDRVKDHSIRLRKIAENCEIENENKAKNTNSLKGNEILKMSRAIFSWNDLSNASLEIDGISIYTGTLNLIIGEKGSGKTSLLSAVLGEMICVSGKIEWKKYLRIGYVPETPWLLNDTIKLNITFGCSFQEKHFSRVIQLCALRSDINTLPNKELTVVGDRGHALSGGQKQRIMIARMLYSRPDVIIMDDPFCALDSKTTNYIFENTIKKFLAKQNKTVIMVTNCKKFLSEADQIIVMENLRLKAIGSYAIVSKVALEEIQKLEEVVDDRPKPRRSVRDETETSSHRSLKTTVFIPLKRCRSILSGSRYFTHDLLLPTDDCDVGSVTLIQKQKRSRAATVTEYPQSSVSIHQMVFRVSSLQTNPTQYSLKKKKRFDFEDEFLAKRHPSTVSDHVDDLDDLSEPFTEIFNDMSSVWDLSEISAERMKSNFKIYVTYIKNCGPLTVLVYFLLTFGWQMIRILTEFCLSIIPTEELNIRWYLYLYISLSLASLLLSLCSTATGQYAGSVSRKFIHKKMLNNVMECSMQFFDNVSFGQIINRFSADIEIIDKKIPTSTQRLIQFQLLCLSAILLNCFITPWFVILVIPIALVYYKIQMFYRRSSKEFQHLENLMKTPIISHFSETFNGLEVIRALDQSNTFQHTLFQRIDAHTNIFLISNASNRWLGIMLDYLGGIVVFAAMILSLLTVSLEPTFKTSTIFGLAINYTLLIPIYLTWVVKFLIDLDIYMGAVDRIRTFSKLSNEDYNLQAPIPKNWPNQGAIEFTKVTLKYSDEGPAVLQNFNLRIEPRQKVGICGRTGSSKSSLMMSLFRMIPRVEGKITIDDVDIDSVPLQYLRSKISIVPQDIILFSGTIRQNLDLRGEFTDEKLWYSLRMVRMDDNVIKIGGLGRHALVQDGGSNLSAGEKQLICLARAILRDTSCLILDEATNTLQPEMEIEFVKMVLEIFDNSTVIIVTHRVTSMLDFDRILVMDNGAIVEDGSPRELIALPNSKFFSLIKTTQELSVEKPRFYF